MSLANYREATETVRTPGGDITVRGLTTADLAVLVRHHKPAMSAFFDRVVVKEDGLDLDDLKGVLAELGEAAPELMAHVIALAADSPEHVHVARRLPFPTQIELLEKIGVLTFATEGALKNLVATVIRMLSSTTEALEALQA